jgi:hypothetical protein
MFYRTYEDIKRAQNQRFDSLNNILNQFMVNMRVQNRHIKASENILKQLLKERIQEKIKERLPIMLLEMMRYTKQDSSL